MTVNDGRGSTWRPWPWDGRPHRPPKVGSGSLAGTCPRHVQPPSRGTRSPHWFRPLSGWGELEAGELLLSRKATSDPIGEPQIGLDERQCVQLLRAHGLRLLMTPLCNTSGLTSRRVCVKRLFTLVAKTRCHWTSRPRARPLQGMREVGTHGRSRWLPRPNAHEVTGPTKQKAHRRTVSHKSLYSPPDGRTGLPVIGCKGQGRSHTLGSWRHLETQGTTWNPGDTGESFWGRGGKATGDKPGRGEPASSLQRDWSPHLLSARPPPGLGLSTWSSRVN